MKNILFSVQIQFLVMGLSATLCAQGTSTPFAPFVQITAFVPPRPAAFDFNQDGYLDEWVSGPGQVSIQYGLPTGGLGPPIVLLTRMPASPGSSYRVQVGDMDEDGTPDLLLTEIFTFPSPTVIGHSLYPGDGAGGVLAEEPIYLDFALSLRQNISFAPFGVAVGSRGAFVAMAIEGSSVGQLPTRLSFIRFDSTTSAWLAEPIGEIPAIPPFAPFNPVIWTTGADSRALQGDFNGDGILDLILEAFVSSPLGFGSISFVQSAVLYGLPQSPWLDIANIQLFTIPLATPPPGAFVVSSFWNFTVTDLNDDQVDDLVAFMGTTASDSSVQLEVQTTFGGSQFPFGQSWRMTPVTASTPAGSTVFAQELADLDEDGLVDLVFMNGTPTVNEIHFLRGNPDGLFSPPMIRQVPLTVSGRISQVTDLDGDGDLDLIDYSPVQGPGPWIFSVTHSNESLMGMGVPATSGRLPLITRGTAQLGNRSFFIGVERAPANAPCLLGVSLAPSVSPGGVTLDFGQLPLPLGAIGPGVTDASGTAFAVIPLPLTPALAGVELYFQWGIATANSLGFSATQVAKIILWP